MGEEAVRQRRNLVVLSFVLSLYYLSTANFEILGVEIRNVEIAQPIAWAAVAFFTWRFWVHAHGYSIKNKREAVRELGGSSTAVGGAMVHALQTWWPKGQHFPTTNGVKFVREKYVFRYSYQIAGTNSTYTRMPYLYLAIPLFEIRARRMVTSDYLDTMLPYLAPLFAIACAIWGDTIRNWLLHLA